MLPLKFDNIFEIFLPKLTRQEVNIMCHRKPKKDDAQPPADPKPDKAAEKPAASKSAKRPSS